MALIRLNKPIPFTTVLLSLCFLTIPKVTAQQDTTQTAVESTRFVIRLPMAEIAPGKLVDTLPLMIASESADLAGFDLKIGCDSKVLTIVEVLPGEVNKLCSWEYFAARDRTRRDLEGDPTSLWKLVGLARASADTIEPECLGLPRNAILAHIVVVVDWPYLRKDTTVPLFFYWEACTDNLLSTADGSAVLASNNMFDYSGSALTAERDIFPTRRGTPRQCIKPGARSRPRRVIDFHQGGITLASNIKLPSDSAVVDTELPDSLSK